MTTQALTSVAVGILAALAGCAFVACVWGEYKRRQDRRRHEEKLRCIAGGRGPWWGQR